MKAVITAGGKGTRLRPITHTLNKHLIPIANKPMVFYAIEKVKDAGIHEIGIIINEGDEELPKFIGDGSRWDVKITYIPQVGGARGLAHAVASARAFVGNESFLFYLGDNIVLADLKELIASFETQHLTAMLAFAKVNDPQRFGVPEFDTEGKLVRVLEKPDDPPSNFAVTGIYVYTPEVLDAIRHIAPSSRGELEISDVHTWLLEHGKAVGWKEISGWWKDTGKPEDLLDCNQLVLETMELGEIAESAALRDEVSVKGRVSIGSGSKIGDKVLVRGPVIIGANCTIENSYIGPYTSIGSSVRIKDTEIENSIIFDGADIFANAAIVDSLIGSNTTIRSSKASLPLGHKLIIGDNALVEL